MDVKKLVGDKKRWKQYKARAKALPDGYREAVEALERYLMYFGSADGEAAASMFEDLVELFEAAAADGTPVRAIVGENPVEFMEAFIANYSKGGWIERERTRLNDAIKHAAGEA
jgi:DNA-binding ferritin-like protein (Dps family)